MDGNAFNGFGGYVAFRLADRNKIASELIEDYAGKHGLMDVGVGLVGLIPGASIPALMAAIGLQVPVIYQPLARKLQAVYTASPEDLDHVLDDVIAPNVVLNTGIDIAADFGTEFLLQIASELLVELGFSSLVSFIPFVGAVAGAYLDYEIAQKMTHRVGRMVAMYFQNNASWVRSKEYTYELSKETQSLNALRDINLINESLVRNIATMVNMMRQGMSDDQIRTALKNKGVPNDLIEQALRWDSGSRAA